MASIREQYISKIADVLQCSSDQVFLYWKGRVALYAILKAAGIGKGDHVIIPAFTCVVVPNAIKYLGAKPIYVDINEDSLNTSIDKIKEVFSDKVKAIICQNTFGLSSDVQEIASFCKEHNILSIEDCTHGFGGEYKGKPNGTYCDAAFYSSQWNKPHSTGVGGMAYIQNDTLLKEVIKVNKGLIKPSFKNALMLKMLLVFNTWFLNDTTYWFLVGLYRWLSKMNIVVGSSGGEEISGLEMPSDYFMDMSNVQISFGNKSIQALGADITLRKSNAKLYTEWLKKHNKYYVKEVFNEDHSFLKYPILVSDRDHFIELAEKSKVQLGEWFNSPIHPVQENHEMWDLNINEFPNARDYSSRMVNLPTDLKDITKVMAFIDKNKDLIE